MVLPLVVISQVFVLRICFLATVCDGVSVCASAIVQALLNVARDPLLPFCTSLPCSDLGQGVALIITAFTTFRFFAQTHIFSVSLSSFSLSPI